METWERLKIARELKGYSQQEFALLLDMTQQAYSPYESKREMKATMLKRVCRILGCTPSWLLGLKEDGACVPEESKFEYLTENSDEMVMLELFRTMDETGKKAAIAAMSGLAGEFGRF